MASNLTAGADPRLDKHLDHVIQEFLLAQGGNHEIRQIFKEENTNQFEDFVGYKVEHLKTLRRKSYNTTKGFAKRKIVPIYNVIRYYNYLQTTANTVLAEDPENWVKANYKKWI